MGLPGYLYPGDRTLSQEVNGPTVDWAWWKTKVLEHCVPVTEKKIIRLVIVLI